MSEQPEAKDHQKSVEHRPSETAMAAAMLRAFAFLDDREEIRGTDGLAAIFLNKDRQDILKDRAARQSVMKNGIIPGMYEFMMARTAFFDGTVEKALRDNIPQIVFLGAGYDSRPYRFRDVIRETRIFELDIHTTQRLKKESLDRAGVPIPVQLVFVPINFNREDIGDTLCRAGFRKDGKTLFVWEGVTYYLSSGIVDDTLRFVRNSAPAGSSICFDYASLSTAILNDAGVKKLREMMKSKHSGEPAKFGIREGDVEPFLRERGFRIIEHLAAVEMEKRYLSLRNGSSAGKVPTLFCLVHAEVSTNK